MRNIVFALLLGAAAMLPDAPRAQQPAPAFGMPSPAAALRYDTEYPAIRYSGTAANNRIAQLQARLERGETKLEFQPAHGYLESLLKALDIDPSSQVLIYSKTSLQTGEIQAASPRAVYFNEDTYVGWVQGSDQMELGSMDSALDQVFYTFRNRAAGADRFKRETTTCLGCHDSLSLSGGGVPRFLLMSSYVDTHGEQLTHEGSILMTDHTEFRYRWGGWYVSGRHGDQVHLGNLQVHGAQELVNLESLRRGNLDDLDSLFDTKPYLSDKSDLVALLILLHQVTVQDRITEVNFDVRTALARMGQDPSGGRAAVLPAPERKQIKEEMDALVEEMLFAGEPGFAGRISGNAGFDKWFQARGPRDAHGRSLRELDLTTRLFKYPLSYLVYSQAFDALPVYARDYVYGRFRDILGGNDSSKAFSQLSANDRKALLEILSSTKPEFSKR